MSKALAVLALALAALSGFWAYNYISHPCDRPVLYSIGSIDPKFGISKEALIKELKKAEVPWEKVLNKNLFQLEEEADLKVNMIYDERQRETEAKRRTEFGLSSSESIFKELDAKLIAFKASYDSKIKDNQEQIASFKKEQAAYEAEVSYWNSKGGAPKSKYQELNQKKGELDREIAEINKNSAAINAMTDELNSLIRERNAAAESYNKLVASYNNKFGRGLEFDQAEYTGVAINVYQFSNNGDLDTALSHELGHALGMGHVEDPKSIMFAVTESGSASNLSPTGDDIAELKKVCKIK